MENQKAEITTSFDELVQLVKGGYLFNFCVAYALNKGFKNALKGSQEVKFNVGDYEIEFHTKPMHFSLIHKIYIARIIHTYPNGETVFIGDDENWMINDILNELEKGKPNE